MDKIVDNYVKKGTSIEKFISEIKEMDDLTEQVSIDLRNCSILHHEVFVSQEKVENPEDYMWFTRLGAGEASKQKVPHVKIKKASLYTALSKELIKEIENNKTILYDENKKIMYLMSKYTFATLLPKLRLQGESLLIPSRARDIFLASVFAEMSGNVKILTRKVDAKHKKVFAVFSDKHDSMPLMAINNVLDVIRAITRCEGSRWEVSQEMSEIYVTLPDMTERISDDVYTPGIRISISDIGRSALNIQGFWKYNDTYAVFNVPITKFKRFSLDDENFWNDYMRIIRETIDIIMDSFESHKFITKMREFQNYDLLPLETTDYHNNENCLKNQEIFLNIVDYIIQESGVRTAVGRKRTNQFVRDLTTFTDWSIPYTFYDAIKTVLDFPMSDIDSLSVRNNLVVALGTVPYMNVDKINEVCVCRNVAI